MKTSILSALFCLVATLTIAQQEPIALTYDIGRFTINQKANNQIADRLNQLDPSRTYMVRIVGSADFLGSIENNITLSNKRVKFAEYHLLQNYSNLRMIIKLNSKGEIDPAHRPQTPAGIQEHRMAYIYIDEYDPSINNSGSANANHIIATRSAAKEERLGNDVPVHVSSANSNPKHITSNSLTAQIERAKQEMRNSSSTPAQTTAVVAPGATDNNGKTSKPISVNGQEEPKRFSGDGVYSEGDKLLLSDMNFRPGSHYLRPSSIPTLRQLIAVLEQNPQMQIEIIGHICCHPINSPHDDGFDREAGDYRLSFNRANNIKDYLVKNGIDESRITPTGMGAKERLVYPEETDQDRIKNRRVEIRITAI